VRVAIIGQGYVGKAVGKAAHGAGHQVIGIENDLMRVKELASVVDYEVTRDYSEVSSVAIIIIAVPTPLDEKREPDLSFLYSACHSLQNHLNTSVLLINESTSFPGTLRNVIAPILGSKHLYASAPERIDPANKIWNIENTPRLVAGLNDEATNRATEFYRTFCREVITVSSPEVAETAKLFENTFRQVNIALVNEFAQISDALGISTFETIKAASSKPYGFMPFMPSIGVGGHCIPIDPTYLSFAAREAGVNTSFIDLANKVNALMPEYLTERIKKLLGGNLVGKRIQIAGISYKADISDIRESPALALLAKLREQGADVTWHDEKVGVCNGEESSKLEAVDLGIIATAHSGVDYSSWKNTQSIVIDLSTNPNTGWKKFL
jgi:UDP-N-acetyl-D-glucosamine dehydrogenase